MRLKRTLDLHLRFVVIFLLFFTVYPSSISILAPPDNGVFVRKDISYINTERQILD